MIVVSTSGSGAPSAPSASSQAALLDARTGRVIRTIPVAGADHVGGRGRRAGASLSPDHPSDRVGCPAGDHAAHARAPGGTLVALVTQGPRALVVGLTTSGAEGGPWTWLPSWVPFLPQRGRRVVSDSPRVSLIDTRPLSAG